MGCLQIPRLETFACIYTHAYLHYLAREGWKPHTRCLLLTEEENGSGASVHNLFRRENAVVEHLDYREQRFLSRAFADPDSLSSL